MSPTFAERIFKRLVLTAVGAGTYWHLGVRNRLVISGRDNLSGLPETNVLFVANHQTWFLDVIAIYQGITRAKASPLSGIDAPLNVSFIAARETMERRGLLPRFFAAGGAVCVSRTWREGEEAISRAVDPGDVSSIEAALRNGWVFTFPQGTTQPNAPGRRGTAHLICARQPVVIPVVLSGFRETFDKSGLKIRNPGAALSLRFKAPLEIDHSLGIDSVLAQVMESIEQARPQADLADRVPPRAATAADQSAAHF